LSRLTKRAELDFPVELARAAWSQDRLVRIEDGVRPLREDRRLLRNRLVRLLGVVAVVEADADELSGIGDRRVQPRRARRDRHPFLDTGHRLLDQRPDLEERTRAARDERRGDLGRPGYAAPRQRGCNAGLEIADPVALQDAEPRGLAVGGEAYELHD